MAGSEGGSAPWPHPLGLSLWGVCPWVLGARRCGQRSKDHRLCAVQLRWWPQPCPGAWERSGCAVWALLGRSPREQWLQRALTR